MCHSEPNKSFRFIPSYEEVLQMSLHEIKQQRITKIEASFEVREMLCVTFVLTDDLRCPPVGTYAKEPSYSRLIPHGIQTINFDLFDNEEEFFNLKRVKMFGSD